MNRLSSFIQASSWRHAVFVVVAFTLVYAAFFGTVIFTGRLLIPGDAGVYYFPTLYSARTLWETNFWGGFPVAADQQTMTWYPLAWLFSLAPALWNLFNISAYLMASCFTYGYVYTLTRSRAASFAAGCIYGLCGFMTAHLGHTTMIHTAAWLPLVVWSFERLRAELTRRWIVIGAWAISCAALAGHPQILAYTLCVAAAYVLWFGWRHVQTEDNQAEDDQADQNRAHYNKWRYFATCLLLTVCGVTLAAVQLVPAAELGGESYRASITFEEFTTYRLALKQIPTMLFPFLYGGAPASPYAVPYFGEWASSADGWGIAEVAGYVGLLPLLLAGVGAFRASSKRHARFWLAVALFAFLLVLGSSTPLAWLTFRIPVINLFRAPARHFAEFSFAVSVLAGFGVQSLIRERLSRRALITILSIGAGLFFACLAFILIYSGRLHEFAASRGANAFPVSPFTNLAIIIPPVVFALSCAALIYFASRPDRTAATLALLAVIVIDLCSFSYFGEWRYSASRIDVLSAPAHAEKYRASLQSTNQRMLPVRGGLGARDELPPQLSRWWRVPSASGYGPLILARVRGLLNMPPHGSVDSSWRQPANQALNLMAIRYVFAPHGDRRVPVGRTDARGVQWSLEDLGIALGDGCATDNPESAEFEFDEPVEANAVALVTQLACSTELADNAEIARVVSIDDAGMTSTQTLRAGRDSSEWAWDCSDVRGAVRHSRAEVFASIPVERAGEMCSNNQYTSLLPLDANSPSATRRVKRLRVEWNNAVGTISLNKMSLVNESAKTSVPVSAASVVLNEPQRWRVAEDVGGARVYENLQARPRAWLVGEALQLAPEASLAAIRTSQLPGGAAGSFDPARVALVEQPLELRATDFDPSSLVEITDLQNTSIKLQTSSRSASFLVLSDVYYPGWQATIDDAPTKIYLTDYVLRGVALPPGGHTVRFFYQPQSLRYGLLLSFAALIALAFCAWRLPPRRRE